MTNNPLVEATWLAGELSNALIARDEGRFRTIAFVHRHTILAALASSAPATGESEQIVGWLRDEAWRLPLMSAARCSDLADAVERGDHRTQSVPPASPGQSGKCSHGIPTRGYCAICYGHKKEADRTQSGEMEGFQITREIERNPYGKGWPDWMKGVTIGGYAEQGWAAFYEGRHLVSGEWGEYLKRSHLPAPDSGNPDPLTNQDGGEKP